MIKMQIGTVMHDTPPESVEVKGRDLITGVPKTVTLTSAEVQESLREPVEMIVQVVREALENTPPELSADLVDTGIMLAGGGALLRGLDRLIAHQTGLPVQVADNALFAVVDGAGKIVEELDFFKDMLVG